MSKQILFSGKIAKLFSLALFILIIACNDKKEDANGNSDAKADSTEKVMAALGDLPALCISKQEFIDFLANQPGEEAVGKLVFIFNWDDPQALNPSLTVFRAKVNGKFLGGAVKTLDRKHNEPVPPGVFLFGNLEITKQKADNLLSVATGNDTGLWFIPGKTASNHVLYKLYWGDCATPPDLTAAAPPPPDGELNPSPPADPG